MKQSGFDKETQDKILNEMKSGDYINLLRTFEKYFGSVYTLQTSNPEYLDAFMVEKVLKELLTTFVISASASDVDVTNHNVQQYLDKQATCLAKNMYYEIP